MSQGVGKRHVWRTRCGAVRLAHAKYMRMPHMPHMQVLHATYAICHMPLQPHATWHMPFAICHMPYAIPYAIRHAICHLPHAICHMPSAICHLPYAICHMPPHATCYTTCHIPHATCHMPHAGVWHVACGMWHVAACGMAHGIGYGRLFLQGHSRCSGMDASRLSSELALSMHGRCCPKIRVTSANCQCCQRPAVCGKEWPKLVLRLCPVRHNTSHWSAFGEICFRVSKHKEPPWVGESPPSFASTAKAHRKTPLISQPALVSSSRGCAQCPKLSTVHVDTSCDSFSKGVHTTLVGPGATRTVRAPRVMVCPCTVAVSLPSTCSISSRVARDGGVPCVSKTRHPLARLGVSLL